jgi:FtsP/CotA-like multicopper oxidase with cupredoxin domain
VPKRDISIPLSIAGLLLGAIAFVIALNGAQDPESTAGAPIGSSSSKSTSTHTHAMSNAGSEANTKVSAKAAGPVEDGTLTTLKPKLVDGVKVYTLEAKPTKINLGDGKIMDGMGYNGSVPGPTIEVNEGDHVKFVFTNHLKEATTVHWHGLDVPSEADGVPGLTQDPIKPGATFTYEFDAKPAGTHFYHTHGSGAHGQEAGQMDAGLAGAFIVHGRNEVKADIDVPLILGGGMQGMYTLNGGVFPHTKGLTVKTGQLVRLRMINAGSTAIHPMHVHGHQVTLDAIDGNPVPKAMRMLQNTITVDPGQTMDLLVRAYNPGKWVIHCHDLNHVSGGMAMPFIYSDYKPGATPGTPTVTS